MRKIQKQLKTVIQLCVDLEKKWNTEEQEKGEPIHLEDHNRLCRITGGVISRLMHSSGSAYEQDTSFAYGPLHLLGASAKGDFQKGLKRLGTVLPYHIYTPEKSNGNGTEKITETNRTGILTGVYT